MSDKDELDTKRKRTEEKTTSRYASEPVGVDADQIAQVDRWCEVFPWLLIHYPDLTHEEIQRRLSCGENNAPKIEVNSKFANVLLDFLTHPKMDQRLKDPAGLKKLMFERFEDIFAQHFDQKPTNIAAYLKLFTQKGPNGAALCGATNTRSGTLTNELIRLRRAYSEFIHVNDPRNSTTVNIDAPVLVIAGESGSGKTHAALTANPQGVTIYLLFGEDFKRSDNGDEISRSDRKKFTAEIVAKCTEALPPHKNLPFLQKVPLRIVIDEMGRQPTRLHLAISECEAIFQGLAEFGWDHTKDNTLMKIFCVGTGVAHVAELLCSKPGNAAVQTLGASGFNHGGGNVLIELWRANCGVVVNKVKYQRQLAAVAKFSQHRYISPLLDNYRAAAILVAHIDMVFSNLLDDVEESALMSSVETALFYVSKEFKSLNALDSLTVPEVKKSCALGLQTALCGPTLMDYATTRLSKSLSEAAKRTGVETDLVCSLGVLTERVADMMALETEIKRLQPATIEELQELAVQDPKLAALVKLPRFTMSRSVAVMMLGGFGQSVSSASSQSDEKELEKAVAMKLLLVMRSCRSIRDVRKCLIGDNVSERTAVFTPPSTDSTLLQMVVVPMHNAASGSWTGEQSVGADKWTGQKSVAFWELRSQFSRPRIRKEKSDEETTADNPLSSTGNKKNTKEDDRLSFLRRIAGEVNNGSAALIINGKGAPYADIVLVAPGLLCFVQCNQAEVDVSQEVHQILHMGHNKEITDCLCHIAGVGREQIDILLVTTKKSVATREEDGHGCRVRVVTPSTEPHEDFLFPFAWPSTPTPETERPLEPTEQFDCFGL